MAATRYAELGKIIKEFDLEVLYAGTNYEKIKITAASVNRPGLQLTGFYDYFYADRLQFMGKEEMAYVGGLSSQERRKSFEMLFSKFIPALIVDNSHPAFPELLEMAEKYDCTVLRTDEDKAGEFLSSLVANLKRKLAPCITRHGVLLEVYGEGVLLLGESGVGKSETAVELIKRGHRLIADDAVELKKVMANTIEGSAPEMIRYYMELRGIGVIDVRHLFGMSAIKKRQEVDLIINLEQWREDVFYDRLGVENQSTSILEVQIPTLTIPVKPGRNLAVIVEVAAMNNRHKKMGYNAAMEFTKQINEHFDQAMADGMF